MRTRCGSILLTGLLIVVLVHEAPADPPATATLPYRVVSGDVATDQGELRARGKSAVVAIGQDRLAAYRVTAEVQLAAKGNEAVIVVMPTDTGNLNKKGALRVGIGRNAGENARSGSRRQPTMRQNGRKASH